MAYTTINKSSDYFNTKLYTGNSSTNAITGVGFQPDWVWIKNRSDSYNNALFDAVRGVTKFIASNNSDAEQTNANELTAFGTDGFTTGNANRTNNNSDSFVSWNWKANGAGSANTDGDINSTVSANTTAGFSIVKYTGNGLNDQTVGHGLGARPTAWFIKRLGSADDWIVYHQGMGATQSADWYDDTYMYLNSNSAKMGSINAGTGNPTSSVFYIGSTGRTGVNGDDYIAYVFAEKTGFSKFGQYASNNSTDGSFVYTGFKPNWVMVKSIGSGGYNWMIFDSVRQPNNLNGVTLQADTNGAEFDYAPNGYVDLLSNGFKLRSTSNGVNGSGATNYLYMAFGQSIVGSNNIPATAR